MHAPSEWLYRIGSHRGSAMYPVLTVQDTKRLRIVSGLNIEVSWGNMSVERTLLGIMISVSIPGIYSLELTNTRGVVILSLISSFSEWKPNAVVLGDTIPGIYGFSIRGEQLGHKVSGKVILV